MIRVTSVRRSVIAWAVLVTAAIPSLPAQSAVGILAGVGTSSWSGPYVSGGKFGAALAGVSVERRSPSRIATRAELAFQRDAGDLGVTGLFEQPTTLLMYRAHLAALARFYPGSSGSARSAYVEAGISGWLKAGCDVDLEGGPGFFGGETLGCSEWLADESASPPLRPRSAGANAVIGVGTYVGRFGISARYEPFGSAVIDTDRGALHARSLTVALEWVPGGRH